MFQQGKNWYNGLRAQHKLMLAFALHRVYWFVIWLVFKRFIFNEQRFVGYHPFYATPHGICCDHPV